MQQLTPSHVAALLGRVIQSGAQFYLSTCSGAQPGQAIVVEGRSALAAQPIPPGPVVLVQSGNQWLAYPPRQEAGSQRVVQSVRRSPAPSGTVTTGPWWGVDYYFNFSLGEGDNWYPGLHLALRGPARNQIITFRHRGAEPPAEGQFSWELASQYNGPYQPYNNCIWVDSKGKPHSLTTYIPRYSTGSWPNAIYDWDLLATGWWVVATHDKGHQIFKAPRSIWPYTDTQRLCNNWAWAFPEADYNSVSQGMAPTPGYTVDLETIQDASGIQYFDIAPINDDGYFNAPGRVIMGDFEYSGTTRLFPGGPEPAFAYHHVGGGGGRITEEPAIPTTYTTEADPLYQTWQDMVGQPGPDYEGPETVSPSAPLDATALAALSLSEGGALYRVWFPLTEQALQVQQLFINESEIALATTLEAFANLFDNEGRLLARIPAYWASVEREDREGPEHETNPRGIALYLREIHLGGTLIGDWLAAITSISVIGATGQILYYESRRDCEYTLPLLVNLGEKLRIEERYQGFATAYAEAGLAPFNPDPALRQRDYRWTDTSTQGTFWVKQQDGQPDEEKPADGQMQIYFPIPDTQMVPDALTLAVGQEYTLNYSQSVPPGLYDASGLPIHLIKLEGTDYGHSEALVEVPSYDEVSRTYQIWDDGAGEAVSRTSTTQQAFYGRTLNQNQARPEAMAGLVEKLSLGAKMYGTYQGSITPEADQTFPENIIIFRAEVISADYELLSPGSWVPAMPAGIQQITCASAALVILKQLRFRITELIGATNFETYGPFGDFGQPFFHYPNLPLAANPGNYLYRYSGYLYCEGSIRNIFRTGDNGAGLLAHSLSNSPWLGLNTAFYWDQQFAWKHPYLWGLHRNIDSMDIAMFHRFAKLDGQGNIVRPAKKGRLVPRWRIDDAGATVRCWLDGIHAIPEPHWPKGYENDNFSSFQNAALDLAMLYREAQAEQSI